MNHANAAAAEDARSAELRELRESARDVLAGLGIAADERKAWPQLAELGWLLVGVPEAQNGLGQGMAGACAFHSELGRSLATASYTAAMLAVDAVSQSQCSDQASWLERLTTGEYVAAPLADATLRVTRNGSKLRLDGELSAVPSADRASHVLVCGSDGSLLALVPLDRPGLERISRPTWDTTRRLFHVCFKDVSLEAAVILAEGAAAPALIERFHALRDFSLAADAVGGADALLAMTVDYLQSRRQFGRPLALFQALKHRCADLKMQTVAAEALLLDKLAVVGNDFAGARAAGRIVKQFACSVYARVAEEALQLHGGIGMTSEHVCHLFLKRALLNEQLGQRGGSYESDIADAFLGRAS